MPYLFNDLIRAVRVLVHWVGGLYSIFGGCVSMCAGVLCVPCIIGGGLYTI